MCYVESFQKPFSERPNPEDHIAYTPIYRPEKPTVQRQKLS